MDEPSQVQTIHIHKHGKATVVKHEDNTDGNRLTARLVAFVDIVLAILIIIAIFVSTILILSFPENYTTGLLDDSRQMAIFSVGIASLLFLSFQIIFTLCLFKSTTKPRRTRIHRGNNDNDKARQKAKYWLFYNIWLAILGVALATVSFLYGSSAMGGACIGYLFLRLVFIVAVFQYLRQLKREIKRGGRVVAEAENFESTNERRRRHSPKSEHTEMDDSEQ